jgi:outer membrane protein OmpA-like peptidoglycan-associated protein
MAASFTDLMASLMVVFILLFIAYSNSVKYSKTVATESVLEDLKKGLAEAGVDSARVEPDPRDRYAIVVILPASLLFDRGSSQVREGGRKFLEEFTPAFARILCSRARGSIEGVVVQGHTDTTYVGSSADSSGIPLPERGRAFNLELSQNRSLAVVKSCLDALGESPNRQVFLGLLSASGRGQEELLPGMPGDDPRQRRVAFKVRVRVEDLPEVAAKLPSGTAAVVQRDETTR